MRSAARACGRRPLQQVVRRHVSPSSARAVASNEERGAQAQSADSCTDSDCPVPGRTRYPHCTAQSSRYRDACDEIVARAQPDRRHVDVLKHGGAKAGQSKRRSLQALVAPTAPDCFDRRDVADTSSLYARPAHKTNRPHQPPSAAAFAAAAPRCPELRPRATTWRLKP